MQCTTSITQSMIGESYGLKRLLTIAEDMVQSKIAAAINFADINTKCGITLNRSSLRSDQCFTISVLYALLKKDPALSSILSMGADFFEPLGIPEVIAWMRHTFDFKSEQLVDAIAYATKIKNEQVVVPISALTVIVKLYTEMNPGAMTEDAINNLLKPSTINSNVKYEAQKLIIDSIKNNDLENLKKAIEEGADPNFNGDGHYCLHLAVSTDNKELIVALLNKGARIDEENSSGETPLNMAVQQRKLASIEQLLISGAKINYISANGLSSIHLAARLGYKDVLEKLFDVVAPDLSLHDMQGNSALHWSAAAGKLEALKFLYSKGAQVNTSNKNGWTPLHAAAEYNNKEVVSHLLEWNADLNVLGEGGFNPLHMAADKGHLDIVKLFIAKGADPTKTANDGSTPQKLASEGGHTAVVDYLQGLAHN